MPVAGPVLIGRPKTRIAALSDTGRVDSAPAAAHPALRDTWLEAPRLHSGTPSGVDVCTVRWVPWLRTPYDRPAARRITGELRAWVTINRRVLGDQLRELEPSSPAADYLRGNLDACDQSVKLSRSASDAPRPKRSAAYHDGWRLGELITVASAALIMAEEKAFGRHIAQAARWYLNGIAGLIHEGADPQTLLTTHDRGCEAVRAEGGALAWPVEQVYVRWLADRSGLLPVGYQWLPAWLRLVLIEPDLDPDILAHVFGLRHRRGWA